VGIFRSRPITRNLTDIPGDILQELGVRAGRDRQRPPLQLRQHGGEQHVGAERGLDAALSRQLEGAVGELQQLWMAVLPTLQALARQLKIIPLMRKPGSLQRHRDVS